MQEYFNMTPLQRKELFKLIISSLPNRCGYATGISNLLIGQGINYTESHIFHMNKGNREVPPSAIVAAKEFASALEGDIIEIQVKRRDGSVTVL
jgi:hypothetical protein